MNSNTLRELLTSVARGGTAIDQALDRLRRWPLEETPVATLDHHRALRCGHPEVIFCQGKSVEQVVEIARRLVEQSGLVLATRADDTQRDAIFKAFPDARVNHEGRAVLIRRTNEVSAATAPPIERSCPVAVVCAGTADLPVAEEAAMTLLAMDVPALRVNDVGVSGLHRILSHVETLQKCCAIVAIAGMEGALPSVVGGLVACPVFAVPTSVGYGSSMGGLAALFAMLNSCSANVSVVNIDNGFGAAFSAGLVWKGRQKAKAPQ